MIVGVTNVIRFWSVPWCYTQRLYHPAGQSHAVPVFLITILLLQQFDGNILGPKILGGSTGLSSFMVIVAILLFGGLLGIPGMIIGVPVWAVIVAGLKYLRNSWLKRKTCPLRIICIRMWIILIRKPWNL
ncbi:MAG: AI-2E family transporter [Blautia marasmi]